jgi:hypothetical protein
MRELFQGDMNTKLNRNVISKDFQKLPCNCRNKQACQYSGDCRTSIVVYVSSSLSQDEQTLHWKHPAARENFYARPHPRCQKPPHQRQEFRFFRLTLCFPNSGRNRQEKCQGFRQDQGRYPLAGRPTLLSTNFWYQNLQTVSEGMVRYHQAHPHDSQLGYQQVQQGPWRLPPQAEIPQV